MKQITLVFITILLTACDKLIPNLINGQLVSSVKAPGHLNIMIMGQSNAQFMNPEGIKSFQGAMGVNTTVVDCAVGGTKIAQWTAGGTLYAACFAAMPQPDAILWYQGEGDAEWDGIPDTWAQKFTELSSAIRKQAGNIPIVYAQIANMPEVTAYYPAGTFPYWLQIQSQQASVSIPRAKMIKTGDIPVRYDYVHFTTEGYKLLGLKFAEALNQLEKEK